MHENPLIMFYDGYKPTRYSDLYDIPYLRIAIDATD